MIERHPRATCDGTATCGTEPRFPLCENVATAFAAPVPPTRVHIRTPRSCGAPPVRPGAMLQLVCRTSSHRLSTEHALLGRCYQREDMAFPSQQKGSSRACTRWCQLIDRGSRCGANSVWHHGYKAHEWNVGKPSSPRFLRIESRRAHELAQGCMIYPATSSPPGNQVLREKP